MTPEEKRKERNRRHYLKRTGQLEKLRIEATPAGLVICTQCEALQSPDQFHPVGSPSHIGIVSKDETVCANCHWYNDRYGEAQWKQTQRKRKEAEASQRYRLKNHDETGGTGNHPGS